MKINILAVLAVLLVVFSCNQNKKAEEKGNPATETVSATPKQDSVSSSNKFDISNIPLTEKLDGSFPYVKFPEGYTFTDPNKYHGTGEIKEVDKEYFYFHGHYFPMEGKSFKGVIRIDDEKFKDKKFSTLEVQKRFDEFIESRGGVKINNGEPVQNGEKERLEKEDPNAYTNGYQHSCNNYDNVHTYVIRTGDQTVFVQFNLGSEQANITVLEQ